MARISPVVFSALIGILLGMFSGRIAFGEASPPPSYRFSSGDSAVNIPVEVVANGLVFMRAKVNNHDGWFILDNASQGFTVDRDYARRISLTSSGSAVARGGGANAIDAQVYRDVEISLPGFVLIHRNLVAIGLKALEPAVGHEVDGIIGSRLFDDFVVAVDYENHCVSVYLPKERTPSVHEVSFPVRVDEHGFPFIEATIALPGVEAVPGSFLIDGGANTYADIYKPFADAHHIPPATMRLLDEPGVSTGGTTESRDGRAERIEIGRYAIKNSPVTFAQDTEGLMASKDYAGLIGAEFLERFTVVFDNPGKRILLSPNRNYTGAAEYDESGLRVRAEGSGFHTFVVRRIVPHSSAADAGIELGDVIESVDNSFAGKMTLTELRKMLCRTEAVYSVGIMRGNRKLRVELRLRPLL